MSNEETKNTPKLTIEQGTEDPFAEEVAEAEASETTDAEEGESLRTEAVGFIEGFGKAAWQWASKHPNTAGGAVAGFVLAVLVLVIGLWSTIILAVFVFVGALVGQIRDGDNSLVNFFAHLLDRHE